MANESDWFEELRTKWQRWVDANRENAFDRGIWNATVEKYADPAHFLFELMQNAEDEGATQAELVISEDAIVFEHDRGHFTREDIDGITGIGNTTKLDEANKIGCFGIGFKSVYVVTDRPEVHTSIDGVPFAFAIRDLVVPTRMPFLGRDGWTRFVLPLRDKSSDVAGRLRAALRDGGPRSMLFLDRLKSLCWTDGMARERYSVDDRTGSVRVLRREGDHGTAVTERYLVLTRAVQLEGGGEHAVKVALRQNAEGDIVRTETGTKLAVFFETEEQTGLYFHVHGPFRLTDNRANIKRGDAWNEHLVDEIGRLLVQSLPGIRDSGLLKRSFLEVLPNGTDGLAAPWSQLPLPLVAAFKAEALAPAQFGGHLPASKLMRGPADLRELLGDGGLQRLSGKPDVRWSVTGLRNSREELFLGSLGIPEWAMTDLVAALSADPWGGGRKGVWGWFDGLSDEAVQRLYLLLDGAKVSSTSILVRYMPLIRLENGTRVQASKALLPQIGDHAEDEVGADNLALVKQTLVRSGRGKGKETREFLLRVGVQVVSERHYLEAIAKRFYKGTVPSDLTSERHLRHIRRFIAWWKEHKDVEPFADAAWLRGEGVEGYLAPERIYLDAPYADTGLGLVFGGRVAGLNAVSLWAGYARLKREDLIGLVQEAGVSTKLVVKETSVSYSHPQYAALKHGFCGARRTNSQIDEDYVIEGLAAMLALKDESVSALVWRTMAAQKVGVLRARYCPNQNHPIKTELSTLAHVLATTAWMPAADGTMTKPRSMKAADLALGFDYASNAPWLDALGFGADHRRLSEHNQGRRKAAESMGLPPGFADALGDVPTSERQGVIDLLMKCVTERPATQPEFPERSSPNPGRRARRIAENAQTAPLRSYEMRERSVRTSDGDAQASAKEFLRDYYTNDTDEMVCQACHEEMPFRMADGRPYFEAVEYLPGEDRELAENHLALCPNCAAKWRYANGETRETLLAALCGATEPRTTPTLAGQQIGLRFVDVHLQDLRSVLGSGGEKPDEEAVTASG